MLSLAVLDRGLKQSASAPSSAYDGLKLAFLQSEASVVPQAFPRYGIVKNRDSSSLAPMQPQSKWGDKFTLALWQPRSCVLLELATVTSGDI